ncbi:hypothetical protein EG329_004938 [Mollisiaceae sp. DMI_Dod_QoI]|nr:hypothetical protein EG329_004938 [Helotiales sp. DMI_Dod_QoI]
MNNSQFRKLVLDTPARQANASSPPGAGQSSRNGVGATPSALGSRMRSSIPMTPRSVAGSNPHSDFARQLAERNSSSTHTQKKFRSSAAPKGAKLPQGYVDRAKQRIGGDEEEENDKVKRVKVLEEMMKLQQIDEETFVKLREEILGDDVGAERAGLVKGLDWSLLQRVRRGEVGVEDVLEPKVKGPILEEQDEEEGEGEGVDDEFEKLEEREVEAVVKEKAKKKGEMAPPALTGKKRTRDQILAEMKAARQAAKEAAQPSLGTRFKKVGERRAESRIERDSKGREVLITVDEDGNEKRKVRKVQVVEREPEEKGKGLLMPDKDVKPLGMEVPDIPKVVEEEEDIDIFDDIGDDYDPLAGLEEDDSEEEGEEGEVAESKKLDAEKKPEPGSMAPPPKPKQTPASRNYFGDSRSSTQEGHSKPAALSDPVFMAALKKASSLNPIAKAAENEEEAAKEARRKRMLQQDDRDAQDMDMGFGSSRFEDEEDFEEKKVKLSVWGGDDDGEDGKGEGKGKRKRGPKKRKGDANSAADVLKVMERRKAES